jgi:hypothetical protein
VAGCAYLVCTSSSGASVGSVRRMDQPASASNKLSIYDTARRYTSKAMSVSPQPSHCAPWPVKTSTSVGLPATDAGAARCICWHSSSVLLAVKVRRYGSSERLPQTRRATG